MSGSINGGRMAGHQNGRSIKNSEKYPAVAWHGSALLAKAKNRASESGSVGVWRAKADEKQKAINNKL